MASQTIIKAVQLFRRKFQRGNVIVEMVIWRLPHATADRPHGIKYRFYCGRGGACLVRYDNGLAKATIATTASGRRLTPSVAWTN